MEHLGDITKLSGYDIPPVDVITGGSPCQDLSVAGKREGLSGARSGLFMEQIRIIKEMREATNGEKPRFMVWENVVGAFSSNKGEDFRIVLEETVKIAELDAAVPGPPKGKWTPAGCIMGDGWSIAWRVHDAQFWGVPQRRRRIALVADFGGTNAPDILFDEISSQCEGLHGNPAACGEEGEETARDFRESTQVASGFTNRGFESGDLTETLRSDPHGAYPMVAISFQERAGNPSVCVLNNQGGNPACNQGGIAVVQGADVYNGKLTGEVAATLTGACGGTNTSGAKIVCAWFDGKQGAKGPGAVCYDARGNGDGYTAPTITDDHENCVTDYTALCVSNGQLNQTSVGDVTNALDTMHDQQDVLTYQDKTGCFDSCICKGSGNQIVNNDMLVANGYIVRRLTPLEAERLQGFPDGWTDIGDWTDSKGKKRKGDADTPRYKALGNSIALPFWDWMAGRMAAYLGGGASMGSLFDGIGGFPLVYMRHGVTPAWASEIDDFCIAVTKRRFECLEGTY